MSNTQEEAKEKARARAKAWYLANKEKAKAYRQAHPPSPEQRKVYDLTYARKNPQKVKDQKKSYRDSHKEEIAEYNRNYENEKYQTDLVYRLRKALRSRLSASIKGTKPGSHIRDLGCTIEELRSHLESKFQEGMTWDNYGYRGWHIDHIVPLCKFDLSDPEQLKRAVHYTNLQPLWWTENLSKGGR